MTPPARNISKKLKEFLNKWLVPEHLNPALKQTLLIQLAYSVQAFPAGYWEQFELIGRFVKVLITKMSSGSVSNTEIFGILKKNKHLTSYPFAATICAVLPPNATPQWITKYRAYQAIFLICCFIRYTHDQHLAASGNENALRELRLVAMDPKHRKLLDILPELDDASSIELLVSQLKELRKEKYPALQEYGLGYLELVLREAVSGSKRRRRRIRIPPISDPDTFIELNPVDAFEDAGLEVKELCVASTKPTTAQERDEAISVTAGRTFRIEDSALTHNQTTTYSPSSRAVRAIQHKCLTEKLSIMQLSLNCSYNQLTEWDIRQLIRFTTNGIKTGVNPESCSTLLLCLLCGRDPISQVQSSNTFCFTHYKNRPCISLTHTVPASKQDVRLEKCLNNIINHLVLPLPQFLQDRLTQNVGTADLKSVINDINKQHQCRLSLGRITRYLEHWYLNNGLDRAEVGLIKGRAPRNQPALSYSNFDADKLIENHHRYVTSIFKMAESDPQLPPITPIKKQLGSALHLPPRTLHNFFRILRSQIPRPRKQSLEEITTLHNHYVCYVWALLTFATGHRDVNAPMGRRTDFSSHNNTWWISDKENRHGISARTLVLPKTALKQLEHYLQHLQKLKKRSQLIAQDIFNRADEAMTGSGNLLFFIKHREQDDIPQITQELTPARVKAFLGDQLPWPGNWGRHHMRSELKRLGVAPEEIDGWMGHEDIGEESMGRHSMLSTQYLNRIAQHIESLLNTHEITVVDAWKTH